MCEVICVQNEQTQRVYPQFFDVLKIAQAEEGLKRFLKVPATSSLNTN